MNIQKYVLPDWKSVIRSSNLPEEIKNEYLETGKSMAEYLDRQMMQGLPDTWYDGWVRYHYALNTDSRVIKIHQIIGDEFSDFVNTKNRDSFDFEEEHIHEIQQLQEEIKKERQEHEEWFTSIKKEVDEQRETRDRGDRPTPTIQPTGRKSKQKQILDRDVVYDRWMEIVDEKDISQSYWHIHEYLSRFILDWAEENADGRVTQKVVEDFIEDYSEGKRPKTMNHYKRVARYFLEFYQDLEEELLDK